MTSPTNDSDRVPAGEPTPDPAVEAFLRGGSGAAFDGDRPDWAALERELAAERGIASLRGLSTPTRALAVGAVAVSLVLLVLFGTPRPDLSVFPLGRMVLDLALLLLPLSVVIAIALRPLHRPALPTSVRWGAIGLAFGAVLLSALLPAAHVDHPASLAGVAEDFAPRAVACFGFGTLVGIPMVIAVRLLGRSGRGAWRFAPSIAVAAVGVLVGSLGLYVHCPITASRHLLAGHVLVWLPFALVAWLTGRHATEG